MTVQNKLKVLWKERSLKKKGKHRKKNMDRNITHLPEKKKMRSMDRNIVHGQEHCPSERKNMIIQYFNDRDLSFHKTWMHMFLCMENVADDVGNLIVLPESRSRWFTRWRYSCYHLMCRTTTWNVDPLVVPSSKRFPSRFSWGRIVTWVVRT